MAGCLPSSVLGALGTGAVSIGSASRCSRAFSDEEARGTLGGMRSAAAARRGGSELSLSQDRRGSGGFRAMGTARRGPRRRWPRGRSVSGVEPTGDCPRAPVRPGSRDPSQPPGRPGASTRCRLCEHSGSLAGDRWAKAVAGCACTVAPDVCRWPARRPDRRAPRELAGAGS